MAGSIDRRAFLRRAGAAVATLAGAPPVPSSRAAAAGDRLVIALGGWQSLAYTPMETNYEHVSASS
jgi:hypothetical protein